MFWTVNLEQERSNKLVRTVAEVCDPSCVSAGCPAGHLHQGVDRHNGRYADVWLEDRCVKSTSKFDVAKTTSEGSIGYLIYELIIRHSLRYSLLC